MDKLRSYILSHLSILFFSIFLPLFAIASVIFLIKMATYTAVIQLSVSDMGKLYLFVLPDLFFYTLPVAFIISAALTLYRLSNDNEMVVVFSLGISPSFLAKILAKPALMLSLLLFVDYLVVAPYINIISESFLNVKKSEAQFNLTSSEYGHNFGDWMMYINKSDRENREYGQIVLFNKEKQDEILITADEAKLLNNNGLIQLKLSDGKGYTFSKDILKVMKYKTLKINDTFGSETTQYNGIVDFWQNDVRRERKQQTIITNALLSLFPLISVYFIIAIGIVHARHQKRSIYLLLFFSIVSYYTAAMVIQKWLVYWTIPAVSIVWLLLTYGFYRHLVGKRF